jgi:hypothetical protein
MTFATMDSAGYEVGYGKPPRHTQFQKGRSGNPRGRPRRQPIERAKALVLYEAYRTVMVQEDGYKDPVTCVQAILRSQLKLAAAGNVRAQCAVLKMIQDIESEVAHDARRGLVNDNDDIGDDIDGDIDDDIVDGRARQADGIDTDRETGAHGVERQEEKEPEPDDPPLENAMAPPAGQQPAASASRPRKKITARGRSPKRRRRRTKRGRPARAAAAGRAPDPLVRSPEGRPRRNPEARSGNGGVIAPAARGTRAHEKSMARGTRAFRNSSVHGTLAQCSGGRDARAPASADATAPEEKLKIPC